MNDEFLDVYFIKSAGNRIAAIHERLDVGIGEVFFRVGINAITSLVIHKFREVKAFVFVVVTNNRQDPYFWRFRLLIE
jgi:hypothetical protein